MQFKGKQMPIWATPYPLWILLSLPAVPIFLEIATLGSWSDDALRPVVSPTGQYSAWLLIIALMATPLSMLFRGQGFPRWLVQNRRYFGVSAFLYGLLHTVLYLAWRGILALNDIYSVSIFLAWILLLILIPLAFTSTDGMVKRLGPGWKKLQRWAYAAAILTFLHWITLHGGSLIVIATVSFLPLAVLVYYRLKKTREVRSNVGQ